MKIRTHHYTGGSSKQENMLFSLFANPLLLLWSVGIAIWMYFSGIWPTHVFFTLSRIFVFLRLPLFLFKNVFLDLASWGPIFIIALFILLRKARSREFLKTEKFKKISSVLLTLYFLSFVGTYVFLLVHY